MDSPRLDHWLRRLWLVNGIALLVLIADATLDALAGAAAHIVGRRSGQ